MPDSSPQPSFEDLLAAAEAAPASASHAQGIALAEHAAAAAAQPGQQAAALRLKANLCMRAGRNEDAASAYEHACALFEQAGETAALSETLTDLTLIYVLLGLHDEALKAVGNSREIATRLGDTRLLYWAHNRTGVVHSSLGEAEPAHQVMLDALALAESLGDHEKFCILNNLADNIHIFTDRYGAEPARIAEGIAYARRALEFVTPERQPYQVALAQGNLGYLLALAGDFSQAMTVLDGSLASAARHGHANLVLMNQHFIARVKLLQGDITGGIAALRAVLRTAGRQSEKPVIARVHTQLSAAYEALGDPASALSHYKLAHATEREYNTAVAQSRARMMSDVLALEKSKLEAERSRLEAEFLRLQSAALLLEKHELQAKADQDSLTGLYNRRYADAALVSIFARAAAEDMPLCIALCDIDRFKQINDQFGHAAGDAVLRQVAAILISHARQSDLIARIGGEEFLIAFVNSEITAAAAACERLRAAVAAHPWAALCPGLEVTLSIGLRQAGPAEPPAAALAAADRLLYLAKQSGRNNVQTDQEELLF